MFFCKYKFSVIKTIIKKYKRKVILIALFSIISIVGFSVFFVQENIESIISKRFSENKLINLDLSDVSISLNGKISLNNLLVSNKANDTIFYSKAVGVDPVSLIDALNNNDLKFNNISLTQGKIYIDLLSQILSTDSNLMVDNNSISIEKTLKLGVQRFIGTLSGGLIGFIVLLFYHPVYWEILLWIFILILLGNFLTHYYEGFNLFGLTATIVILLSHHQSITNNLAFLRIGEILVVEFVNFLINTPLKETILIVSH